MRIEIPGTPLPKARHRSMMRYGKIFNYDPQQREKECVRNILCHHVKGLFDRKDKAIVMEASRVAYSDSFCVNLFFYLPYPKSRSVSEKNRILWGIDSATEKPDIDNLAKFYLDCANGILFPDDKKIVKLNIKKSYSNNPRTVIEVMGKDKIRLAEKAEGILETLNPEEFSKFLEVIDELLMVARGFDEDGSNKDFEQDFELHGRRLAETASFLSLFAETYAVVLSKIRRKWPKFHEEYDKCKTVLQGMEHV